MSAKFPIVLGSVFAMTGIVLGALGAHALKDALVQREMVDVWKTAVSYQMWHALALLILGVLGPSIRVKASIICFVIGTVLFSGSLYWISFEGPRWLGPITPLGGLLMIGGWVVLMVNTLRKN